MRKEEGRISGRLQFRDLGSYCRHHCVVDLWLKTFIHYVLCHLKFTSLEIREYTVVNRQYNIITLQVQARRMRTVNWGAAWGDGSVMSDHFRWRNSSLLVPFPLIEFKYFSIPSSSSKPLYESSYFAYNWEITPYVSPTPYHPFNMKTTIIQNSDVISKDLSSRFQVLESVKTSLSR